VRKEIETLDENKGSNLTMEQLSEVAGGGKDDDGGKGGVICPQCKVENHPAHTSIRNERRFTCLALRLFQRADRRRGRPDPARSGYVLVTGAREDRAASGRVLYELF